MVRYFGVRLPACILALAGCLVATAARPQMLPSDIFLSRAAAERAQGGLLSAPVRALRVATLEWEPLLAPVALDPATPQASVRVASASTASVPANADSTYAYPPPLVLGGALPPSDPAVLLSDRDQDAEAPAVFGPSPNADGAYLELALDQVLTLPGLDEESIAAEEDVPSTFGPDMSAFDTSSEAPQALIFGEPPPPGSAQDDAELEAPDAAGLSLDASEGTAQGMQTSQDTPIVHDMRVVFGQSGALFPPLPFEYAALPPSASALPPMPPVPPPEEEEAGGLMSGDASPATRLALAGPARARAEKCLAEAIYFESRGEPKRGQIAVAQVVMNRVFSGYYPNDVCKTVYQNAHRHLACQFTFACDDVKDVIREPDMWVQAKQIASDMLDGKLWLSSVGRATHYHAYWVRPSWVREMRKLDRIGVHTFYRPRRWGEG